MKYIIYKQKKKNLALLVAILLDVAWWFQVQDMVFELCRDVLIGVQIIVAASIFFNLLLF
jgi:hypothetical protein